MAQSVQQQIEAKLGDALDPTHLVVENESANHNVPPNSETHFKVVVVSAAFEGLRAVQRHQQVYGALSDELAGPVHALALHTYTPAEWATDGTVAQSPECLGGGRQ